ncbi:MAG: enoyl-CoA hydratase/isomerase family protein [Ectothiorhodospiraceae bacterium]|nr:enoyl-CoA hydratase/isomerase family protein [Ectothiorhodospiraceae bacterium]
MDSSRYQMIDVVRHGRVLELAFNRPDALNAINEELHDELGDIFYDAALDRDSDILLITGRGRAFSAGGDLQWARGMAEDPNLFERTALRGKRIVYSMLDCEKPIVAKVNGPAMGLGATIALFSDVIFAAQSAVIADPHVTVGVVAGDGGAVIWPQLIGYARAKEYLLTGKSITASDAAAMGLINHAVPDAELDAAVNAFIDVLLERPVRALRWTKATANIGLKQLAHSMMDAGLAYEGATARSHEHLHRLDAFFKSRDKN